MGRISQPQDNSTAPARSRGRARCSHSLGSELTQPTSGGRTLRSFPSFLRDPRPRDPPGTTLSAPCCGVCPGRGLSGPGLCCSARRKAGPSSPLTPREGPFSLRRPETLWLMEVPEGGRGRGPWIPWKSMWGGATGEGKTCLSSQVCSDARNFLDRELKENPHRPSRGLEMASLRKSVDHHRG